MIAPGLRFAELVSMPEGDIPLDEAALLIAAHAHPDLDVDAQLARLDQLAKDCPAPTLDGLRSHLFDEIALTGNGVRYEDPATPSSTTCSTRGSASPSRCPWSRWRWAGGWAWCWREWGCPGISWYAT